MSRLLFCRASGEAGPDPDPEATHFVTTTGNNTDSQATYNAAQSAGSPCSFAVALRYAVGGDVVSVAAGTYVRTGSNDKATPAFQPTNSGSSGNPITFSANGTVVLQTITNTGATIGAGSRDYIHWLGHFYVDEADAVSAPDMGPCVFVDAEHCRIDGAEIIGRGDIGRSDNYPGIRLEHATDIMIRNVVIQNFKGEGAINSPAIQLYKSGRITIEHCEIFNSDGAIALKGTADLPERDTVTIRYNYVHDILDDAFLIWRTGPVPDVFIHQNLIIGCNGVAVKQWNDDADIVNFGFHTGPHNVRFVNNTVIPDVAGMWFIETGHTDVDQGHVFKNNLIGGTGDGISMQDDSSSHSQFDDLDDFLFDRNLYAATLSWSMSTWKTEHSGQDANSVQSNPTFVDAGSGNYRLAANGQTGLTLGRAVYGIGGADGTTIPVGCYINGSETIGPES